MVEVYTPPFIATTSTVISSSDANAGYRGNVLYFRQFLSANPANVNLALISTGANGAAFSTVPDAALALPKVQASTTIVTSFTSLVAAARNGFHEVNPAADGPTGSGSWYCLNVVEQNVPGTYAMQIAAQVDDQTALWFHLVVAGVAGAWNKIWHGGNDGSGSGLDADLLDGHDSAFFATATGLAAINQVPSGAIVAFETLAELTAAGAGWARYTAADGRLLIGAGTTFSQTFAQATNYGATWTPFAGATVFTLTAADQTLFDTSPATSPASAPSHTHQVTLSAQTWLPVARGVIWGRKT